MEFTYKQAEYHALFHRESGRVRFLKIILKLSLLMDNFMCVYSVFTVYVLCVQCMCSVYSILLCVIYVWCVYSRVFTVCALCVHCMCTVCKCVYSLHTHLEARSQPQLLFLTVLTPLFSEAKFTESEAHQIG